MGAQSPDLGATNQWGLEEEQEEVGARGEAQVEPEAEECLWRVHLQKVQSRWETSPTNFFSTFNRQKQVPSSPTPEHEDYLKNSG